MTIANLTDEQLNMDYDIDELMAEIDKYEGSLDPIASEGHLSLDEMDEDPTYYPAGSSWMSFDSYSTFDGDDYEYKQDMMY